MSALQRPPAALAPALALREALKPRPKALTLRYMPTPPAGAQGTVGGVRGVPGAHGSRGPS